MFLDIKLHFCYFKLRYQSLLNYLSEEVIKTSTYISIQFTCGVQALHILVANFAFQIQFIRCFLPDSHYFSLRRCKFRNKFSIYMTCLKSAIKNKLIIWIKWTKSMLINRNRVMRSRKRVACILLLLAVVFAGCWLPYHITNLLENLSGHEQSDTLNVYLLLLGHANSALNPIIYCALSRNFRNSIKNLFKWKIRCRKKKNYPLNNWAADSSGSGFQIPISHKALPLLNHPCEFGVSRRQSSQKTRSCAV
ncbi:hypothetical protein ABEB36_003079 [Hypothenemus hampei]|uniref:G-protein coupled receptors family 1 profile domain-containing protein n=1 Tax=Hypothenemus hampei TaxID=57062 RepID=A0ABD1F8M7_HYPHA